MSFIAPVYLMKKVIILVDLKNNFRPMTQMRAYHDKPKYFKPS